MDIATQLAVFLENKPGTLALMCAALKAAKINIIALMISDSVDHSVVRMVVSDSRKALLLLEERNVLVIENEVLLIENDNCPGSLGRIAERLAKGKLNIEYAYFANSPRSKKGFLVVRPNNVRKALKVLSAIRG